SCPNDAAHGTEIAVHEEPHRHRRGVPPACREPPKEGPARRPFVEMERLRIELRRETFDSLSIYPQALRATKALADFEIVEVSHVHAIHLLVVRSRLAPRHPIPAYCLREGVYEDGRSKPSPGSCAALGGQDRSRGDWSAQDLDRRGEHV